jgi:hypothetical protein
MDRDHKRAQAILITLAREDPNVFLAKAYTAGLDVEDLPDVRYLINIARRSPGYDPDRDPFRINKMI